MPPRLLRWSHGHLAVGRQPSERPAAQASPGLLIVAFQAVALTGCVLVGLLLVRSEDLPIVAAILLASAVMFFGWPAAWLGFGLAWTIVGALLLARPEPSAPRSPGFA